MPQDLLCDVGGVNERDDFSFPRRNAGSALESADEVTLSRALEGRRRVL
jgi:hypothetical protein